MLRGNWKRWAGVVAGIMVLTMVFSNPLMAGEEASPKEKNDIFFVKAHDKGGPSALYLEELKGLPFALGKGYLGVEINSMTPELREYFGAPADSGVQVTRVSEESPAAEAGIRVGDVIAAVNGEAISSSRDLVRQVRSQEEGAVVRVDVYRQGRLEVLDVSVGARDRALFDVGQAFDWSSKGGDGFNFHFKGLEGLDGVEVPVEVWQQLGRSLEGIDWSQLEEKLEGADWERYAERAMNSPEMKEKMKQLEERLKKMELELRKLEDDQ